MRVGALAEQARNGSYPGDAVDQHMMEDQQQSDPAVGQPGDEHGRPQWPRTGQRVGDHLRDYVQQGASVTRGWAGPMPDMLGSVELGVVDPYRPAAARRHRDQPLP